MHIGKLYTFSSVVGDTFEQLVKESSVKFAKLVVIYHVCLSVKHKSAHTRKHVISHVRGVECYMSVACIITDTKAVDTCTS